MYRPAVLEAFRRAMLLGHHGIIHDCQAPSAMRTLWIFGTWQWARRLLSLRLPHNKSVGPAERPGRLTRLCGGIVGHTRITWSPDRGRALSERNLDWPEATHQRQADHDRPRSGHGRHARGHHRCRLVDVAFQLRVTVPTHEGDTVRHRAFFLSPQWADR